jgi:hypothetical protein
MPGDEKERHCAQCKKSVHALKELTPFQIALLYLKKRSQLCIRLDQTREGNIVAKMPRFASFWGGFGQSVVVRLALLVGFLLPVVGKAQEGSGDPLIDSSNMYTTSVLDHYVVTNGDPIISSPLVALLTIIEGTIGSLLIVSSTLISIISFLSYRKNKKRYLKILSIVFFVFLVLIIALKFMINAHYSTQIYDEALYSDTAMSSEHESVVP